jgi:dihydroorotate dehydrogenase electron transfer subunit
MKQVSAPVISNTEIMSGVFLLWLQAPQIAAIAQPGQFTMVRCGSGHDLLLQRPFSIHRIANGEQIAILYNVVGQGTEWLSQCREGSSLDLLGPLGKGFTIKPSSRKLLLVAGGIGIAPLVFLVEKALNEGCSLTMLMGVRDASLLYPRSMLPPSIELVTTTEDGSEGRRGMVTELMDDFVDHADQIFACGPVAMYKSIASQHLGRNLIQVSLEERMGCGVGACYSCTIKTRIGLMQVCRDGPVFDLDDILW